MSETNENGYDPNWKRPNMFIGHLVIDGKIVSSVDAIFRENDTGILDLEYINIFDTKTGKVNRISNECLKKFGDLVELKLNHIVHCSDSEL